MRRLLLAAVALMVLAAGCSDTPDGPAVESRSGSGLLVENGLAGRDVVEIVDDLDRLPLDERPAGLMASVESDHLVVSDADDQVSLDLPEDLFYVSVAPYVTDTHDCFYHSLTTCKGELGGKDARVTVTADDGTVLVDEERTTFDNGFVGLWLPRDISGTVAVEIEGRKGQVTFSTGQDDPTCLTTLQLA